MRILAALVGLVVVVALDAAAQSPKAPAKAEQCAACHGPEGNSTVGDFPILAGQTFRYLYLQLRDFQEGRRKDPVMSPMAEGLTRDEVTELSQYFAAQKPKPNGFKADAARVARGAKKTDEVLCPMCHLGGFSGQNEIPRVAGQHYDYIVKQLRAFKDRTRTNDAGNMTAVARTLTDEDIIDLANYIANL
ncbi:MAG TPA: c-type cytochrome [Casimicrobiaceae bacterium]|jgi:cytochrome c553